MSDRKIVIRLFATVLGVAFFLLYTWTAAPSIVALYDDSLEFQLVGPTFGIAHPTGYPLYTLLGGLWSRVLFPVGNWAWRMNIFSALAGGVTVALLFRLTLAVVEKTVLAKAQPTQSLTPGLVAALALGLSPVWWSQTTLAEVYALHNLLVVAALLLAVQVTDISLVATQKVRRMTLFMFTLGLGLAHHRMIALVVPGLIVLLWGERWIWRPSRNWLQWGIALLAPILLYLYIPLRAAMGVRDLNGSYVNTWEGFWHHVFALGYTGFFTPSALTRQLSTTDWARLWVAQYGVVGLGLALIGLGWGVWRGRNRQVWRGLFLVLLANVGFAVAYRVGDPEVFMLPAWLSVAPWIGVGVAALRLAGRRRRPQVRALQALLLFAIVTGIGGRGAPVNRSGDWTVHDDTVALAKVDFPPDSRVIGLEGQVTALRYMQAAEGLGQNATGVVANEPDQRLAAVAAAMQTGSPTYLTQEVAGIAETYSFSGEGPLVRIWPRGAAAVQPPDHPLQTPFVDGDLLLVGYDLTWRDEAGGPTLEVALYWQPRVPLTMNYKLSLRLQDTNGTMRHWPTGDPVVADRFPLHQVAPTTSWLPGESVRDVHRLATPVAAAKAANEFLIILYDAATLAEAGRVTLPVPGFVSE